MNLKINTFKSVAIALSLIAFNPIQASNANARSSDIDFFKGNWECKLQNFPYTAFRWSVIEENSWLSGSVKQGQNTVSNDFWRIIDGKIERLAFASEGLLVKVEGSKWEANKLVLLGSFSKQNEVLQVRETIERKTDKEFRAIWQKLVSHQRWATITDERCIKQ